MSKWESFQPDVNIEIPDAGTHSIDANSLFPTGSSATDAANFTSRLAEINRRFLHNDLLPAPDNSEIPSTLARAATLFDGQDIGVQSDGGCSSGSAVSLLLKASGADIRPSMDISDLNKQLQTSGWQASDYTAGDELVPGDLLFTSMAPHGRNVGIVGADGRVYSHNLMTGRFEGRMDWSSKFTTVLRAPE